MRIVAVSGAGDDAPLAEAVEDCRRRVGLREPDGGAEVGAVRRESADIEWWEARRRGRFVRLWAAVLEVRVTALDAADACLQLTGLLRRPRHRVEHAMRLCRTGQPEPCGDHHSDRVTTYPCQALAHRGDRSPHGPFERAHADAYIRALMAGRARALAAADLPVAAMSSDGALSAEVRWRPWRVRHYVRFLAGPGEAPARAAELAATVVDDAGFPLADVVALTPDDGHPGAGGRWTHPACALGRVRAVALWDDYDAAESDIGDPAALAALLTRAADRLRKHYGLDGGPRRS